MLKIRKNQKGFSTVEPILIIVIIALIGVVGWLVYKNHHKTTTVSTTNTSSSKPVTSTKLSTQPTNPYAGWQSFCSSYGDLCLKYPTSWTLKTTTEAVSTTQNTEEANITSPSGNVTVQYQPDCSQLVGPPASGKYNDAILSVTSPPGTSNFKVIKGISSYQSSTSNHISESLYLTSNLIVQQQKITVGTFSNATGTGDEAAAGFFENPSLNNPNDSNAQECMNVGMLDSSGANYVNFSSTNAAQEWFSNSEVQTADQILLSVGNN